MTKRDIVKAITFGLILTIGSIACRAADPTTPPPNTTSQPVASATSFKTINVDEYEKLRSDKNNVVLDVRTPKEFSAGHIPGATNIDFNSPDFDKKITTLDPKKTYLVNCAAGGRSAKACTKLGQLRIGQLYNLEGGLKAWERAGHQPEK